MADDFYDQTERIRFGWGGRLALLALVLALCLLLSGCVTSGPVRRVLDEETSVLCYVTNTAIYCMQVHVDNSELEQNLAALPTPIEPTDTPTAGKGRQGD